MLGLLSLVLPTVTPSYTFKTLGIPPFGLNLIAHSLGHKRFYFSNQNISGHKFYFNDRTVLHSGPSVTLNSGPPTFILPLGLSLDSGPETPLLGFKNSFNPHPSSIQLLSLESGPLF